MAFNIALSGLNAAMADLDITGNNIANASTTGFKSSRGEFVDLLASAGFVISSLDPGDGVRLAEVRQQFSQGNISFTGNALDLAISGGGFFAVRDPNGASAFTRNGTFSVDRDGFVVNPSGARLQAFDVIDSSLPTFNSASTNDLQLLTTQGAPQATTQVNLALNIDPRDPPFISTPIDPELPATYDYSTTVTVYDSLGETHAATVYFQQTSELNFTSRLVIDGLDDQTIDPGNFEFNSNGELSVPDPATINYGTFTPSNGAEPLNIVFNFADTTNLAGSSTVNSISQDGFAAGRLSNIDIDESGIVFARFSNGQSDPLGRIALARFQNPQGLRAVGDTQWVESFASGPSILGEPGGAGLGSIQGGSVESSNVNISEELVNLISAQRNFQANAQVISTADELNQTLLNIR
ncbi:MAG: flagellar hook protein FlgE [Lysobacterales bacterium]